VQSRETFEFRDNINCNRFVFEKNSIDVKHIWTTRNHRLNLLHVHELPWEIYIYHSFRERAILNKLALENIQNLIWNKADNDKFGGGGGPRGGAPPLKKNKNGWGNGGERGGGGGGGGHRCGPHTLTKISDISLESSQNTTHPVVISTWSPCGAYQFLKKCANRIEVLGPSCLSFVHFWVAKTQLNRLWRWTGFVSLFLSFLLGGCPT